jgi:hypothetical protein
MAKKNMKSPATGYIISGVVFVVILYLLSVLPQGNFLASVTTIDDSGNIIKTDTLLEPQLNKLTQSLFGSGDYVGQISLMSTVPSTEESPISIFKASARNPFVGESFLRHVTVYKNDVQLYRENINMYIDNAEEYQYLSQEVNTAGIEARKNTIKLLFEFEQNDEIKNQEFVFEYFTLKPCTSDYQCVKPNIKCDLGNLGRFSTSADETFCTMPCLSTSQCPDDQICRRGICGY